MANQFPNVTRLFTRFGVLLTIIITFSVLFGSCMTTSIGAGEGGVKYSSFSGTDLQSNYGEGLHFHAPWASLIKYDVKVQEKLEQMNALSSNGLTIDLDVSVLWRPKRDELSKLHTNFGSEYYRKLIQPELRSAVRQVVGRYTPEELYSSKREELQNEIQNQVKRRVEQNHILIDAILIRKVVLPTQIKSAIEKKLTEEQEAQRYEFTLQKEQLEAERKKIEAEGQAEYQRIINASLSPSFLKFKGIEATLQLSESENSKVVVVGGNDGLPLILGNQ